MDVKRRSASKVEVGIVGPKLRPWRGVRKIALTENVK
jgi:hypothetical protein